MSDFEDTPDEVVDEMNREPEPSVAEIVGDDPDGTWHHDRLDPACDFYRSEGEVTDSALHRCRICREEALPVDPALSHRHVFEDPEQDPDAPAPSREVVSAFDADDEGTYRPALVNVRMNSDGGIMEQEYAVGLRIRDDAHPVEVISPWIADEAEVRRVIKVLRADPDNTPKAVHVVMRRWVSEPEEI